MTFVDLTQFFPYTFLIHAVRAFAVFNITNSFVKSKYNSFLTFIAFEVTSLAYAYIMLNFADSRYEAFIGIIYIFLCVLVACVMTQGKFFVKLLAIVLSNVVYFISGLIQSVIVPDGTYYGTQYEVPLWYFMLALVFSAGGSFVFVALVKVHRRKERSISQRIRNCVFLIFPITHLLSMLVVTCCLQALSYEQYNTLLAAHPRFELFTFGICILCLAIDFAIVFAVEQIDKLERDAKEKEEYALKSQMTYQQTKLLKEEKDSFRKIKHDMLNILTTAKGFIEIGKPEKALGILSKTGDDLLDISGFQMCSNEMINTVLYIKQKEAGQNNIKMTVDICEEAPLRIDDYDLCRLLHNNIDNALNATLTSSGERQIKINISIDSTSFVIESENDYDASGDKQYINRKAQNHGNGVVIIKEICSKYGGEYTASQNDGIWRTRIYLDNKMLSAAPVRVLD